MGAQHVACPQRRVLPWLSGIFWITGLFGVFLLSGCATPGARIHTTPLSPTLEIPRVLPVMVDYELLGFVSGEACEGLDQLKASLPPSTSSIEPGTGHPVVYQAAKYNALEKAANADNLMSIRVKVTQDGRQQCVTVTGRAYRVRSVKSAEVASATAPRVSGPAFLTPLSLEANVAGGGAEGITDTFKAERPTHPNALGVYLATGYGGSFSLAYTRQGKYLAWELGSQFFFNEADLLPYGKLSFGYTLKGRYFPHLAVSAGYWVDGGDPYLAVGAGIDVRVKRLAVRALLELASEGDVSFSFGPSFVF